MRNIGTKLNYFGKSLRKRMAGQQALCPYCHRSDGAVVDQKAWVTSLIECAHCKLLYRTPTDSANDSLDFYQAEYTEGFTTDCPDEEELRRLKKNGFAEEIGGYSYYLEVLKHLGLSAGSRLFDFGCSWGYGSYYLSRAGYEVEAFEISAPRCAYAVEKLGIKATCDMAMVGRDYDLFFSAHVLEHVPDLRATIEFARTVTKPGGLFLAFTPNGSQSYRESHWPLFHKAWGLVHPNFLQDAFYRHIFKDNPYLIATPSPVYPLERIASWNRLDQVVCDTGGWELMVAAVL